MLTKFDEFLCHQIVADFDDVSTSERNWTEKVYFSAFDIASKVIVGAGLGKYPNRNVMDGFGGIALPGRQYIVRASRELRPNIDTEKVGPISYEVVEPLKKIRLSLGENDQGISFDLEFEGSTPPLDEPGGLTRSRGAVVNHTIRYYQLGRVSGKATIEGKTYQIKKESCYAWRDRSWGVRMMAGVPPIGSWFFDQKQGSPESGLQPAQSIPGFMGALVTMQFKECSLFYSYGEGPDGRQMPPGISGHRGFLVYSYGDARPPKAIDDGEFQFEFVPGTRRFKSVKGVLMLSDGTRKEFSTRPIGLIFNHRSGGYYGYKGWWHGKWMGPLVVEGEKLDLTSAKMLDEMGIGEDIAVECRLGDDVGYGLMQPSAIGTLPKYGFTMPKA